MAKYNNIPNEQALELLEQFKKSGESEDLGKLYTHYMEMVLIVGLKYYRDQQKAEDLVMDVFEILYKKAANHNVTTVSSWIYTIAKNECLMDLRKNKKEIPTDQINYQQQVVESEEFLHLFENDQSENEMKSLQDCIDALNEEQKQCIEQFYLQQSSYKDITMNTNFTINQVKSYIQNGKRNLKNCMESRK